MAIQRRVAGRAGEAFRPSPIFLGLVALWATGGVMAWRGFGNATVNVLLFVIAGWLVSLCLHEYAHALLAYRSGDRSVAARGYLTLNPLTYTHPLLSIVLPVVFLLLGGIGLPGGAVWIERHARTKLTDSLISAAGPAVNAAFAVGLAVPFLVLGADTYEHREFWAGWAFLAFLQVTAALLNALPIPGLDGGNAVRPWLSPSWGRGFDAVAPFGMLLLFVLLFEPRVNAIFFAAVFLVSDLVGIPPDLYDKGFRLFQFWR